jgi:hypothetical protein
VADGFLRDQTEIEHLVAGRTEEDEVRDIVVRPILIDVGNIEDFWNAKPAVGAQVLVPIEREFPVVDALGHAPSSLSVRATLVGTTKGTDRDAALAVALGRRDPLLDDYAMYLRVVRDDWFEGALVLRATRATLQGVEHVLESVVDVVEAQFRGVEVEKHLDFQRGVLTVLNSCGSCLSERRFVDGFTPGVAGRDVRRQPER